MFAPVNYQAAHLARCAADVLARPNFAAIDAC
jgi:hypothetical protein